MNTGVGFSRAISTRITKIHVEINLYNGRASRQWAIVKCESATAVNVWEEKVERQHTHQTSEKYRLSFPRDFRVKFSNRPSGGRGFANASDPWHGRAPIPIFCRKISGVHSAEPFLELGE